MRTTSIISIIRRYGLSSRRLSSTNRIKYEDAIKGLEGYQNSELKISKVIDNKLFPNESISCRCQIPGCNKHIRYEYVLENKLSHAIIVAGSTCVWPTLGLSEIEKKDFLSYERAVKEYHDMLEWSKDNKDVVDKLKLMESERLNQFRPFWEEIRYCRLMDEDAEYIRSIDVDRIISRRDEEKRKKEEYRRMTEQQRIAADEAYSKVVSALETLARTYPNNNFYKSLSRQVSCGRKLSDRQIFCIKNGCNWMWYNTKIKGTDKDCWKTCEEIAKDIINASGVQLSPTKEAIERGNNISKSYPSNIQLAWNVYKVKNELVL